MKIEIDLVKKMLDEAMEENLRTVDDSLLLKDAYDKMFNFGVRHMFYEMYNKLLDAEKVARGISE